MSKIEREINIKPSCANELKGLPADQTGPIWEKINFLLEDPIPDGKLKKKLKGSKDPLYRIRAGDFRIFYRFGETWVRLLGIRKRDKDTYKENLSESKDVKPAAPESGKVDLDALLAAGNTSGEFQFTSDDNEKKLPLDINEEWLTKLKVPIQHFPALLSCRTEEQLLAIDIPQSIIELLIDNIFPKPLDEVSRQPDLVVQSTADLIRYQDGELVSFLLKLDSDQKKLTDWALKGPTMIKGGAGTGKSTIILHRIKSLLEQPELAGNESVLFTTYTQALCSASQQLLAQLLTPDQLKRVKIATCDQIARSVAAKHNQLGKTLSGNDLSAFFRRVKKGYLEEPGKTLKSGVAKRKLGSLSAKYLLEEIEWIIDGRDLVDESEYLDAPRPGRGMPFSEEIRIEMWALYQKFKEELAKESSITYSDIRISALKALQSGEHKDRYDFVVIDEAQDLSPVSLAFLAELCKDDEGFCCAADSKQSLYSKNYSWQSAHPRLQFVGRTALLERNYRSTKEIDKAAFAILRSDMESDMEPSESVHEGPLPVLLSGAEREDEGEWIARYIKQMSKHLRMKTNAAAILTFTKKLGEELAEGLKLNGLPAEFYEGRKLDLSSGNIKVMTLHSAKGLEFPIVVIAGFYAGTYPRKDDYLSSELFEEHMNSHRRLLYVGMTRAMRGLAIVVPANCDNVALDSLCESSWHIEKI